MNLLCKLSGHVVATASLENQGFRFSRCTRCCRDMIRSSTAPDASWKCVPDGFQVAWRNVDLGVFTQRSRLAARLAAARQSITGVAEAARIGCAVLCWRAIDRLRGGRSRIRRSTAYALAATRRVVRLGPPKLPQRSWNVTVQITVGNDRGVEPQTLAA